MADLNTILIKSIELNLGIKNLLCASTYKEYSDLSGLTVDYSDSEQLFLLDELRTIMDKLADVEEKIEYLTRPVQEESRLRQDECGKYETRRGHSYAHGSEIEALVRDDYHQVPYWTRTRVDHDGQDYYLVGFRGVSLAGLTVHVRKAV